MPTSSITKEFIVKDEKTFSQIIKELNSKLKRTVKTKRPTSIQRDIELLKQFSFR